jgi:hypothetical protein
MNEINQTPAGVRRHPGRLFLLLGMLLPFVGIAIYAFQVQAKVLHTPLYIPILATAGLLLIILALVQSRSIVRWLAAVIFTAFAAMLWAVFGVLMNVPEYTGPVKPQQPFPNFSTTLADGSTFTQDNLKGSQNTIMVFFRGRW